MSTEARKIIDTADISADIDQAAGDSVGVFHVENGELVSIDIDTTGATSPTGDFELEHSPDWDNSTQTGTWFPVDGGTMVHTPAGTAGKISKAYRGLSGTYKVWWDFTSGSGSATVWVKHGGRGR